MVTEQGQVKSRWALSRSEAVWYAAVGVLALISAALGLHVGAGIAGMKQPFNVPIWLLLVLVTGVVYLSRRRRRTAEDDRADAFFDSEQPPS